MYWARTVHEHDRCQNCGSYGDICHSKVPSPSCSSPDCAGALRSSRVRCGAGYRAVRSDRQVDVSCHSFACNIQPRGILFCPHRLNSIMIGAPYWWPVNLRGAWGLGSRKYCKALLKARDPGKCCSWALETASRRGLSLFESARSRHAQI